MCVSVSVTCVCVFMCVFTFTVFLLFSLFILRQVEFRYLSKITGIPKYAEKANKVFDIMHDLKSNDGLYPIFMSPATGKSIGSQVCVVCRGVVCRLAFFVALAGGRYTQLLLALQESFDR